MKKFLVLAVLAMALSTAVFAQSTPKLAAEVDIDFGSPLGVLHYLGYRTGVDEF
ncbi:hypothetical protein FACS1894161_0440 [Spirochaetia bacterium]|nr:hypothetical protein FACS1894161_0440 [Spirochaetia bacterium]